MKFSIRLMGSIIVPVDRDENAFLGLGRIYDKQEAPSWEVLVGYLRSKFGIKEGCTEVLWRRLDYDTFLQVDKISAKIHGREFRSWKHIYLKSGRTILPVEEYNLV